MNEFDLIKKFLATAGFRVMDVRYFRQHYTIAAEAGFDIGVPQGFIANHQFFFGNVSINHQIQGVVVLTNQMLTDIHLSTLLYGSAETSDTRITMGVNCGMSLLGNGFYQGYKRIYGIGCNRVSILNHGFGAATFTCEVGFNGLMFSVI